MGLVYLQGNDRLEFRTLDWWYHFQEIQLSKACFEGVSVTFN